MTRTYFLDESGNSGDAIKSGKEFDFDGQPIFALACVGIDDEPALAAELARLKTAHKLTRDELKSSSLAKRPEIMLELVRYLERISAPVMIEVIDKRHFVCIHIVNHQLLPATGGDLDRDPMVQQVRRGTAEYLSQVLPNPALAAFVHACTLPSRDTVRASLIALAEAMEKHRHAHSLAEGIHYAANDRLAELDRDDDENAFRDLLPIPDDNKQGKSVWMLPNLACLTNVYARINLAHRGNLEGVRLIHDEQAQFDEILDAAKAAAEGLHQLGAVPFTPFADYRFHQAAELSFGISDKSAGIQVADALAGFVMRYVKIGGRKSSPPQGTSREAFDALLGLSRPNAGTGINFVVPDRTLARLQIPWL